MQYKRDGPVSGFVFRINTVHFDHRLHNCLSGFCTLGLTGVFPLYSALIFTKRPFNMRVLLLKVKDM